jgi:hypothetical protein
MSAQYELGQILYQPLARRFLGRLNVRGIPPVAAFLF